MSAKLDTLEKAALFIEKELKTQEAPFSCQWTSTGELFHVTLSQKRLEAWNKMKKVAATHFLYLIKDQIADENLNPYPVENYDYYEGSVYFVKCLASGLIKIGFSGNFEVRVSTLKTSSPKGLEVLKVIDANKTDEKTIHKRFSSLREKGEWFRPEPELLQYIEGLKHA